MDVIDYTYFLHSLFLLKNWCILRVIHKVQSRQDWVELQNRHKFYK